MTPPTDIPTPAALGLAARAARKQLGLTQPQLALAAGVGVRFIVDLEAGKPTLPGFTIRMPLCWRAIWR